MGTCIDGQLCYGIVFEEDFEFPWYEDGILDWWLEVCGNKNPFDCGKDPKEYFRYRREAMERSPVPFTLVNYCYVDDPMYIVAIPSTVKTASRCYPEKITSLDIDERERTAFLDACKKYLGVEEEPKWYLSSFWG